MKVINLILTLIFLSQFAFGQTSISLTENKAYVNRELPQSDKKFTFAILGDKTGGGEFNWPIFDKAVDEINLLQPDFVIMVGDLIQGYTEDPTFVKEMWEEFKSHAEKLDVPLYVLPGNHDISNKIMYDYWEENIGLRYYSFVHNNSLFILLNSEEYKKEKEGELGKKQLDFVQEQLEANKNVNHTFIFMHRPIWLKRDSKHGGYEEMQKVDSWIKNRKAMVFAGHLHNLIFNKINDKRYIILSATGGILTEKPMNELGYFHHYSIVTVDKDTSVIAYIKPGSILPENIATEKFTNDFNNTVKIDNKISVNENGVHLTSEVLLNNLVNRNVEYTISVNNNDNLSWKFNNNELSGNLKPNESVKHKLLSQNIVEHSIPFPSIECRVFTNGKLGDTKNMSFSPGNDETWSYPNQVQVLGGIPLGFKRKPSTEKDIKNSQITTEYDWNSEVEFISTQIDEGSLWQKVDAEKGIITLDNIFDHNDFAFAYVKFIINSDEDKNVLASMIPDNYTQVYLNEKLVLKGSPFKGVPSSPYMFIMDLKKGENIVLIKTANYYGNWIIDLKVSDPQKKLVFK
ncbi:MAG: metallophosphoesterase [Bacteroidota bacterium]